MDPTSPAPTPASSSPRETAPLSRLRTLALAWPIVLAQAATATTSTVDTLVMGRYGSAEALGAVGVASVATLFLFWAFGFLRMATTGLAAQADGAGDEGEVGAVLIRGLLLGAGLGVTIIIVFPIFRWGALAAFAADPAVETLARGYFNARIWGAPAALMGYAVTGWLIGTGRTRSLLAFQVVLNAVNAGLDVWFVAGLDLGPAGIGAGTAIAEWVALAFGLALVRTSLRRTEGLFDRARLMALFAANRDIMIRTLALLFAFAWFVNAGARVGTAALAGNEVLRQFVTVMAFVLDAFAFVAEKEAGAAYGARDRERFLRAVRITSELSFAFALGFSALFLLLGGPVIEAVVSDADARAAALTYVPAMAAVPLVGWMAYQLDGIFIGATRGHALRNAGVAATVLYVATDSLLRPAFGNWGVWAAFLAMFAYRAGGLLVYWPGLLADVSEDQRPPPPPPSRSRQSGARQPVRD
ncbi:MAG: MATE family efflux transporter [Pseudomonadota bacterium]